MYLENTLVFQHMDWLTCSFGATEWIEEILPQAYVCFRPRKQIKAQGMYQEAYELRCGAILNMNREGMQGCKLDMGGQALWSIREEGNVSDEFILKMVAATPIHKRTTRIDVAFNLAGGGSAYQAFRYAGTSHYKGRLKPRSGRVTPGQRRGTTAYFGSEKSDCSIRVYDKAAEMDMLWMAWTRCEIQLRNEYAQNAVQDAFDGVGLVNHARTKIKESIGELPYKWWHKMMDGETANIKRLVRKESKFEARMEQLRGEILKKYSESSEQAEYIETWLAELASAMAVTR